jgi:hypothetical protein
VKRLLPLAALAALAALLCACDSNDGNAVLADAPTTIDAPITIMDAPFACMPVAPAAPPASPTPTAGPPAACLALAPSTLRGATPFGDLDLALDYFGAGDCITISGANIQWTGACGEQLRVQFSYPVTSTTSGRRVTTNFDTDARFEFKPPGMAPREHVTTIHVDVTQWQEGQAMHDIDITLTITDPAYALPPLHIIGTFCDWPFYVC